MPRPDPNLALFPPPSATDVATYGAAAGIDENGLGPLLGPLVVTAALAVGSGDALDRLTRPARGESKRSLFDSKALVSFKDSSLGEAWGRVLVPAARTPQELFEALSETPLDALQSLCPSDGVTARRVAPDAARNQCWDASGEGFEADAATLDGCAKALAKLQNIGIETIAVRTQLVCAKRLCAAKDAGISRFRRNLFAMEELVLWARRAAQQPVDVTCGKVGGYNFYGPAFGALAALPYTARIEGKARSEYHFPAIGQVAFVRDADSSHQLVALASLVGKWVRDHFMRRQIRFHARFTEGLPMASGYHDKTTARFVEASSLARSAQRFPDDCFRRR